MYYLKGYRHAHCSEAGWGDMRRCQFVSDFQIGFVVPLAFQNAFKMDFANDASVGLHEMDVANYICRNGREVFK